MAAMKSLELYVFVIKEYNETHDTIIPRHYHVKFWPP